VRELFILVIVLLSGAVAGLLSARWAADYPPLSGAVQAGPWRAWPDAGVSDAMPHARLRYYMDDALPPSPVDRLELLAETDDDGKAFSADCVYELKGRMLPVRTWVLSLHQVGRADGVASAVLHAEDVIHQPGGTLLVRLARRAQAGNWLPLPDEGRIRLVLQLFGISPLERERILKSAPFTIHRTRCS